MMTTLTAQNVYPCPNSINIAVGKNSKQSSTQSNGYSWKAVNGVSDGNAKSKTQSEPSAWWEVDFGEVLKLQGVVLHFSSAYELQNYFIFISKDPFDSLTLDDCLVSTTIQKVQVQSGYQSGFLFGFEGEGQYLRIQLNNYTGSLQLIEVEVPGTPVEICNNDVDDDCDDLIDCADSDCAAPAIANVSSGNPSCPICPDGTLHIQAMGENTSLSIDNGTNWVSSVSGTITDFENLPEGTYTILVRNEDSRCVAEYGENPYYLLAPEGMPNQCCLNGDFEYGTFENWTGGFGKNDDSQVVNWTPDVILNTGSNPRHSIISLPFEDPNVPNLPVFNPTTGTYITKLGDFGHNGDVEGLSYEFTVTDCNQNFTFQYLMVDQGYHTEEKKQPFFEYVFNDLTTTEEIAPPERRYAKKNNQDHFFNEMDDPDPNFPDTKILFTFWNCVEVNLSDRVGHLIKVSFKNADCGDFAHYGYTYIDGLCHLQDNFAPVAVINDFKDTYCVQNNQVQQITIDATQSYNVNNYGWELWELDPNGSQLEKLAELQFDSEDPPTGDDFSLLFDLTEILADENHTFECGKSYKFKLILDNSCSEPVVESLVFTILCTEGVLQYPDIVNCGDEMTDIMLVGTVNCDDCDFVWTPAEYLDNSEATFPTILASGNVDALDQVYHVTATDTETGCIFEDDISIFNIPGVSYTTSFTEDFCTYELFAIVSMGVTVSKEAAVINFVNETTGQIIPGQVLTPAQSSDIWEFTSGIIPKNIITTGVWKVVLVSLVNTNTNCGGTDAVVGYLEGSNRYFGGFRVVVPNAFHPDGDGVNDTAGPTVPLCTTDLDPEYSCKYGHNAYWGKIEVFLHWGAELEHCEKELLGNYDLPFDITELSWDGTVCTNPNNPILGIDVYTIQVHLRNCDYDSFIECSSLECDPNASPQTWCPCTFWATDVTLGQ